MSKSDDTGKSIFVSPIRVLKADELENIVGARHIPKPGGRYKQTGGPDFAAKDPI